MESPKKKVWYQEKIEKLEARVRELQAMSVTVSSPEAVTVGTYNDGYADGFFDCLGKYGVLSKLQRRRLHELLKLKGPSAVKSVKRARFSIPVPSL